MSQRLEDTAVIQQITAAQPAAGAELALTVPANVWYKIHTMQYTLVNSAAVASRFPRLLIQDSAGNVVWRGGSAGSIAASITAWLTFERLGPDRGTGLQGGLLPNIFTLPDVWLPPGYVIITSTANKDVADQYSAMFGLASVSSADL